MSSVNPVNGNGNGNGSGNAAAAAKEALAAKLAEAKSAADKDTPQAMKEAAVASKEVVEKAVEKTVEVSNATTSAAIKSDSVQISTAAQEASGTTDTTTAVAAKEEVVAKTEAKEAAEATTTKRDSVQISEKGAALTSTTNADNTSNAAIGKESKAKVEATTTNKPKKISDVIKGLNKRFDDVDGVMGNSFLRDLNKIAGEHGAADSKTLGMVQMKKETLDHLFNGGDANTSFGINRIGDSGEGSGNFSAVNFMSSMSKNIDDGLGNYEYVRETLEEKEARKAEETEDAEEVNGAKQVNAEAEFSTFV